MGKEKPLCSLVRSWAVNLLSELVYTLMRSSAFHCMPLTLTGDRECTRSAGHVLYPSRLTSTRSWTEQRQLISLISFQ